MSVMCVQLVVRVRVISLLAKSHVCLQGVLKTGVWVSNDYTLCVLLGN